MDLLHRAARQLAKRLEAFEGIEDIDDGITEGKQQLNLRLTKEARRLGLDEVSVGAQVRGAFFGAEVERLQRDRDELRVYVRLPRHERQSEYHFEEFLLQTPQGGEVPLIEATDFE